MCPGVREGDVWTSKPTTKLKSRRLHCPACTLSLYTILVSLGATHRRPSLPCLSVKQNKPHSGNTCGRVCVSYGFFRCPAPTRLFECVTQAETDQRLHRKLVSHDYTSMQSFSVVHWLFNVITRKETTGNTRLLLGGIRKVCVWEQRGACHGVNVWTLCVSSLRNLCRVLVLPFGWRASDSSRR